MKIELNINGANKEWQYVNILRVYFVKTAFYFAESMSLVFGIFIYSLLNIIFAPQYRFLSKIK